MHFTAPVGEIAKALDLARLALPQRDLMPALSALHIGAGDNCVTITANILDYAVQASCAAQVESEGATAVPGAAIAGIVSNLAPASELRAHYDGSLLTLMAGRARYKLLTLPIGDLPPAPTIAPIGTLALERAQVIRLLDPAFAADDERTRGYLAGLFLHDTPAGLAAVATDGRLLSRVVIAKGPLELSKDRALIIPNETITLLGKLIKKCKAPAFTLRRSSNLFEVTAGQAFTLICKIIDAGDRGYPAYETVIPKASGNAVIVDRVELSQAVARLKSICDGKRSVSAVGLHWRDDALLLSLPDQPGVAADILSARASGQGTFAATLRDLKLIVDNFRGRSLCIDHGETGAPILVTDPDDAAVTCVSAIVATAVKRVETNLPGAGAAQPCAATRSNAHAAG